MRTTALLLAVLLSLAFAPAPFPKPERGGGGGDDLTRLQGAWVRQSLNGQAEKGVVSARIEGNVMSYGSAEDVWSLTLDVSKSPKRIDFVRKDKSITFRGVYRLEGDTLTYSLLMNVSEADRPLTFNAERPNAWVATYKRRSR